MADAKKLRGFKWDSTNLWLEVWVNGTEIARFDDGTNDLRIVNHGLTVDSGGITITAGALVSDDTTASTSGITGSIHTDGGVGVVMDWVSSTARAIGKITFADRVYHANAFTEVITTDKTLDNLDSGKIFTCATDSVEFNLPPMSTAVLRGCTYTIVNTGADAAAKILFNPGTADMIVGPDIAGVDNKDYVNTKTSAKYGDTCTVMCTDTVGWVVVDVVGTWAIEG